MIISDIFLPFRPTVPLIPPNPRAFPIMPAPMPSMIYVDSFGRRVVGPMMPIAQFPPYNYGQLHSANAGFVASTVTPIKPYYSDASSPLSSGASSEYGGYAQSKMEEVARLYRKSATTMFDARYTWTGPFAPSYTEPNTIMTSAYSCKVFIGGMPWDIDNGESIFGLVTDDGEGAGLGGSVLTVSTIIQAPSFSAFLESAFSRFGTVRVEWPGNEIRYAKLSMRASPKSRGKSF